MQKYLIKKQKAPDENDARPSCSSSGARSPRCGAITWEVSSTEDVATTSCIPAATVTTAATQLQTIIDASGSCPGVDQGRRYQPAWKLTYKWLHYDASLNKVFCETCRAACTMSAPLPHTSRDKDACLAFVQNGFCNWKKALQRFQSSNFHRAALAAKLSIDKGVNIASSCSKG